MSGLRGAGVTADLVRVLREAAEDPARVQGLRRAALAFVKAEGAEQARAGLLQLCAELEKMEYNNSGSIRSIGTLDGADFRKFSEGSTDASAGQQ